MGVPAFFRWLSVKYPKVLQDAIEAQVIEIDGQIIPAASENNENPNGEFDNLYLDMNGIIHPCCHPEDSDSPTSEEDMFIAIFKYIDRLVKVVQPRKLLYMAIDGVAPRAKMNQQRTRRFKTAAEVDQEVKIYTELKEQFESEGRPVPPPKYHWDSNVITPGTPFFDRLTKALRYYINQRMSNDPAWRNLKVILSDASCPGEGEHKIMHYIRAQRTYSDYDPNQHHCLYGADADLIMLGLATHEPHFSILREAVLDAAEAQKCFLCGRAGHLAAECTGEPQKEPESQKASWKPLQFLRIPVLREYLQHEFAFTDASNFQPDLERCIDDFVLMCFFVGNDFLPHLPSLSIHKGSIDQMMLLYQKVRPLLSDYLTDAGKINLSCLKAFVNHLGKIEDIVFQEELKRQNRMTERNAENKSRVAVNVPERMTVSDAPVEDDNFAALRQLKKATAGEEEASDANTLSSCEVPNSFGSGQPPPTKKRKILHETNIDEFKAHMRAKQKAATEIENVEDTVQLGVGERDEWRVRYYKQKFNPTDEDLEHLDVFVGRVATAYAEGLSWVLHYYYQGVCSWDWFYPFHYAPFAFDIAEYGLEKHTPFSMGHPFKPFDQLMAVLPSQSSHCLPSVLAQLMKDPNSPIIDFYPTEFKEDPDGKRYRWQWVVLLPFIDQQRLIDTIQPLESKLTEEEHQRNKAGKDRLFVSQFHSLAAQVAIVQTPKSDDERQQKIQNELSDSLCGELQESQLGFITGTIIGAGENASKQVFPPLPATCLCCEFTCSVAHPHICRFLPGATPPNPSLTAMDLQEDPSRDRRFNAAAAKRIIMGSLGRQEIVAKHVVDQYFTNPRNNNFGSNFYHTPGVHSDNRYQAEMFGTRQKRSRPEEWNEQLPCLPPTHRHRPDSGFIPKIHYNSPPSDRYNLERRSDQQFRSSSYHQTERYRDDYHERQHPRFGGMDQFYHQSQQRQRNPHGIDQPLQYNSSSPLRYQPPPPPLLPSIWTSNQFSLQNHPGRANVVPVSTVSHHLPQSGRVSQPPWLRQQQRDPYKKI